MTLTSNLEPEEELLLCCAQTEINSETEERIKFLLKMNLNWDYLVKITRKHHLQSLLYWQLNCACPENVPKIVLEDLKKHYQKNAQKNLLLLGELLKIMEVFNNNELRVTPYKGPLLTIMVYKHLTLREFGDLDFYVCQSDFYHIKKILYHYGFEPTLNIKDSQEIAYFKYQREYTFLNKSNGIPLEIKWKLPIPSLSLNSDPEFLFKFEEQTTVEINKFNLNTLTPDNLLIVLSIHNAGHLWTRLSWSCDIAELIKNHKLNWMKILENSEKLGINRILSINLYLVSELFTVELPPEISKFINNDKEVHKIAMKIKELFFEGNTSLYGEDVFSLKFYEMILLRIKVREKGKNKLKDLFGLLMNPTREVIKNNSFPLFLFPIYYIFRLKEIFQKYLIDPMK